MPANLALAERPTATLDPTIVQQVLLGGDLSRLSPDQRVSFYNRVCESLGLNPLTQPFAYLRLNGKEVLYAKKDCTEQLRFLHNISIDPKGFTREVIEGVYVVTAPASMPNGRTDVSTGAVPIDGLKGEAMANAMMKAETKAKRRVTLSICGLGVLDETEIDSIPQPLVVEAPKVERAPLPEGHVYILKVAPLRFGANVTVVDAAGVEATYPTPDRQCAELCEQLAQEGGPVKLTLVKGARDGKVKIKAAHRQVTLSDDDREIDMEIAARESDAVL